MRLSLIGFLVLASTAFAGPHISWNYENVRNNECKDVCVRKVLGNCVQWRRDCNYRTKFAWEDRHKAVIKDAMNRLSNRIDNSRVERCIRDHVKFWKGSYAGDGKRQEQGWLDFHSLENADKWPKFDLVADRVSGNTTASAYIGRKAWGTSDGLKWNGNIQTFVNLNTIESMLANGGHEHAANSYAGTLLHEMLHQMGHDHPSTGDYSKDYEQGHFVTVAGDCVASNGDGARNARGLSLNGRSWYLPK